MVFRGLPPEALTFLRKLKRNNRREWFQAHKDDYERFVKSPMAELVLCIGEGLRRVEPEIVADPKASLYRIYRDTRFSPDKTPYKTHVAAVFPVRGLPKNSGPGLYFHLSPEELLIGGGIYMPDPPLLRAVREDIAAHPRAFLRVVEARSFRKAFGQLEGERLKSMPKGFSPDNQAAEYIGYKQFLFGKELSPQIASSTRLLPAILDCFEKGMPLIRFLAKPAKKSLELSNERVASQLPGALR